MRKARNRQLRPFGKYAEDYCSDSDSSDMDFVPDGVEQPAVKRSRRATRTGGPRPPQEQGFKVYCYSNNNP